MGEGRMILLYIAIAVLFYISPLPGRMFLLIIDLIIPDTIPYIDEIVMGIGVIKKCEKIEEFFEDHPVLLKVLIALIMGGIIFGIYYIFFR